MPAYNVTNTAGATVATINVSSTTGATFPIELIGQGISPYAPIIAQSQYRMMEHFANTTAPPNPVTGMIWYNSSQQLPYYYNGTQFIPLGAARSSASLLFSMLPAATNISFTSVGSTAIFQAPGSAERYHPTGIMVIPNGTPTATTPASFNLSVSSSEDVMENVILANVSANTHAYFSIEGTTRFLENVDTLSLNVATAATGGSLAMDAFVFGFVT